MHPPLRVLGPGGPEIKVFDTTLSLATIINTATISHVSAVPQGVGYANRVGDELSILGIELRLNAFGNATQTAGNALRLMVIQWCEDNATIVPTLAQLFNNTGAAADVVVAPYNLPDLRQEVFSVLVDELMSVVVTSNSLVRRWELKPNTRIRYNAAATTGVGTIWVVLASADAVNGPSVRYSSRLLFTDQ